MIRKIIVSKNFGPAKYKDLELALFAFTVLEKMVDNPNFPDAADLIADLKTRATNFKVCVSNLQDRSRIDTLLKKEARKRLEDSLQNMSIYVQQICNGHVTIVYSAGFSVHSRTSRVGPLEKPTNVKLQVGDFKGSLYISCDVVKRALFYVVEYCLSPQGPDSVWIQVTGSRRKILIEGLISGQEYCFRMAAARTDPARIWSAVVKSYVL
jgi:hypothetical protein